MEGFMRGLSLFVGFVAILLTQAPATVLIGRGVHGPDDVDWLPVLILVPVATAGFLICRALRVAASRRYLTAAIRSGRAGWSPAFAYTLPAWLLAGVAGGLTGGTFLTTQTASDQDSYLATVADYPLSVAFFFAGLGLVGAASYYSWTFRRRYEIPVLEAAGVAILVQPPEKLPKAQAVKLRTRMWLQGTAIEALLFASGVLPRLLSGDDRPSGDELLDGTLKIVGGPAITSFVLLLLMLLLWPTRRSALHALARPSSLTALGIVLLAFLVDPSGKQPIGAIIAFTGVLLGSVVCMNIMDRGAQPWLGFVYLAANYILGYLSAPDGNTTWPAGFTGWLIAVLAAVYAIREARVHWRDWTKLEHPADTAAPS
jgi:hypothetical protein